MLNNMATEKELLDRIRDLEEQNSLLQDKLDEIWSVLASEYETEEEGGLVQIMPNDAGGSKSKPQ